MKYFIIGRDTTRLSTFDPRNFRVKAKAHYEAYNYNRLYKRHFILR